MHAADGREGRSPRPGPVTAGGRMRRRGTRFGLGLAAVVVVDVIGVVTGTAFVLAAVSALIRICNTRLRRAGRCSDPSCKSF